MMTAIPRLHLISDRSRCPLTHFPQLARSAAEGGVGAVHIRERDLPDDELLLFTQRVKAAISSTGCLLFVNDRVDVAVPAGADGVHLPERSGSPADAREALPETSLVGMSVHSADSARRAEQAGADYVIAGHIFDTGSKPGQPGRGLEFIRDVSRAIRIPVIGVGGVAPDNVRDVLRSGAHGIAVISAILAAADPGEQAARFREAIHEFEVSER